MPLLSASFSYDQLPLKKHQHKAPIGKADVYPQQANQKEDHFYNHVKQGFQNPTLDDEHKQCNKKLVLENKDNVLKCISDIKLKRDENNAASLLDNKKKFSLNKERFWPNHYRVKQQLSSWMNDLSSTKDLFHLGRHIPFFHRRDELLSALAEHKVPMMRAIWTIKLDAYHKMSQVDTSKKKPRGGAQIPDVCVEWTLAVCQFMENVYKRMLDHEHRVNLLPEDSYQQQCWLWNYTTRLVSAMFEEGLLDKHEFLSWLLQAIQCDLKPREDPFNRIFIPLIYTYLDEIVQSETLARRLAYFCTRNLTQMYENSLEAAVLSSLSPNATINTDVRWLQQQQMHIMASLSARNVWEDYLQCSHHRAMLISLSCALQVITLCCPSALIWVVPRSQVELLSPPLPAANEDGSEDTSSQLDEGSPLDYLAVPPSELPLPFSESDGVELPADVKDQLMYAEELIKHRSMAIEQRWSSAKYQESSFGNEIQRVLEIIEQLDVFNFGCNTPENNMNNLYLTVFKKSPLQPNSPNAGSRNINKNSEASDWLVVKTLCDWATTFHRPGCHRAGAVASLLAQHQVYIESQDPAGSSHQFMCQKHITKFLDEFAPVLNSPPGSESNSFEEERTFTSLVFLIHELIDAGVFSHDLYMRLLISRGDLSTGALFQNGDSSDDFRNEANAVPDLICDFTNKRHLLYALNFPVSPENSNDVNQRLLLLYGLGASREQGLSAQNGVTRDLSALLNCSHEDALINESNIAALRCAFLSLCYHDRHIVIYHCANQISHQLDCVVEFGIDCGTNLPPVKIIDLIFQLSENAANVSFILDIAENILTTFPNLAPLVSSDYIGALLVTAVSAIQNFLPYILINDEIALAIFESVQTAVSVLDDNPSSCSSAERCLLHLLESLIKSSNHLKQSLAPPDKYDQLLGALNQPVPPPKPQESRPQSSSASEDSYFAKTFLENPSNVDEEFMCEVISRIQSREAFRSVFISSALIKLCDFKDVDKIKRANDLSMLCMEVTSRVPFLKSDWFSAVAIICSQKPSGNSKTLDNLIKKINIENVSVYDNVVVFICYMVSRHLFKLEDFFFKLIHYILAILNENNSDTSGPGVREITASTRLSMYVLLKLLHANEELNLFRLNVFEHILSESDRLLLAVQLRPVNVGLLVAILKAFATHVPITTSDEDDSYRKPSQFEPAWTSAKVLEFVGSANLQDVACAVLHALASCTWITYSCLRNPGVLKADEILLDPIGGERLASHILQLLCYPGNPVKNCRYSHGSTIAQSSHYGGGATGDEQETKLRRIFENLNKWNHRSSWLQFTIILELCEWKKQRDLFDLLARLSIQVFDIQPVIELRSSQRRVPKSSAIEKQADYANANSSSPAQRDPEQAWLVAPLIGQLPASVQGAVLNEASSMLDRGGVLGSPGQSYSMFGGGLGSSSKTRTDKEKTAQNSIQLLSHGPFLSLVLTCLKGQDDQRESLLSSLQTQFSQMIKERQNIMAMGSSNSSSASTGSVGTSLEEAQASKLKMFNDEWQLRLSLLGSMFDSILRSQALSTEWILNLVNLLEKDIINPVDNPQLFYTVVDMLIVLMEFNSNDHPKADDASKRSYNTVVKKIRNIIGEKQNDGVRLVRQLLPLPKPSVDVVCCEPCAPSATCDSKGNKLENATRHQGSQVVGKQRLSPWDLIEGFRIHAPLQLNWFGAIKMDKSSTSVYEDQARVMFYHDHSPLHRSDSYFMQPIAGAPPAATSSSTTGTSVAVSASDEDDAQSESASNVLPQSTAAVATTTTTTKSKSRSSRSTSGQTKKQTKSRKKNSQQSLGPVPPSALANAMTSMSSASFAPSVAPQGFNQAAATPGIVSQQQMVAAAHNAAARFPTPPIQQPQQGMQIQQGSTMMVQNPQTNAANAQGGGGGHLQQAYFQQQSQQNMGMSNQAQMSLPQNHAILSQAPPPPSNQMMAAQPQQATPRQQLNKHIKNRNSQQASSVSLVRGQGQTPPQGAANVIGGGNPAARMAVPQNMYRPSGFQPDATSSFNPNQSRPGTAGPVPAMMSNSGTAAGPPQQMVYAVQQQQPPGAQAGAMQQQQQQTTTGTQFVAVAAPGSSAQPNQNYPRFANQQMMQHQYMMQQRRAAMQQFPQQGNQFASQQQFAPSNEQQQSQQQPATFLRNPPPYS